MSNLPDLQLDPPDNLKCDICGGDGATYRQGKNICEPCLDVAVDLREEEREDK